MAGRHRSALHGHSIEFAQHREYVPGDDLRQVDWKVYARSDRYYLKQYEDETNLNCHLLLDQSESMRYCGQTSSLSKLEYAQLVVCSLAYLIVAQQDSAGLIAFSSTIDDWLPPSSAPGQLDDMIRVMQRGQNGQRTQLASILEETIGRIRQPAILVVVSDLLVEAQSLIRALKIARHAGHDVMLIQVLDKDELTFPFDDMCQFDGLEETGQVLTDPRMIAGAYRKAMVAFQQMLRGGCEQLNADYFSIRTDESLASALPRLLARRSTRRS